MSYRRLKGILSRKKTDERPVSAEESVPKDLKRPINPLSVCILHENKFGPTGRLSPWHKKVF